MIETLQDFTASLPPMLQWVGVLLISAIPFVESYFGSAIGVIIGLNPVVAVALASIGNALSMVLFVLAAHKVRAKATAKNGPKELTAKQQKLRERLDRYGVPGVSLLGQLLLPTQITATILVSFGIKKNTVIVWQIISIALWGIIFATLASLGVAVLTR